MIKYSMTLLLVASLLGCDEPEKKEFKYIIEVQTYGPPFEQIVDAEVLFYDENEIMQDPVFILKSELNHNNVATTTIEQNEPFGRFFIFAQKGNLNTIRLPVVSTGGGISVDSESDRYVARLTRTPTKLQFQISDGADPVEDAEIQIYFSEESYNKNLPAQEDESGLTESYFPNLVIDGKWLYEYFMGKTDENGFLLLDNLEPKAYWFRVHKGALNNDDGIYKLDAPLPDDPNHVTTILINIKINGLPHCI